MFVNDKLLLLLATLSLSGANKQCYLCENEKKCEDPFDKTVASAGLCKELDYTSSARKLTPIFTRSAFSRQINSEGENEDDFQCIKAVFENTTANTVHYIRTCTRKTKDIQNECDFTKENLSGDIKLKTCLICDDEICNTAPIFYTTFAILFSVVVLLI